MNHDWFHCSEFGARAWRVVTGLAVTWLAAAALRAAEPAAASPEGLTRPLSLAEAIDTALQHNGSLLKARSELEAAHGVVLQIRAIALPKLRGTGSYQWTDQIEELALPTGQNLSFTRENQWSAGVQLVQSVFEGGRLRSSLRSARLTRELAVEQYQVAVAEVLLAVRNAYYDVLLAQQQILVQQESLALLEEELKNAKRREEAGTVPRFNVLRAEVEVANARPALIRAQNAQRIARSNLAHLLGYELPATVWEDVPLQLTGDLRVERRRMDLPSALEQALELRPELAALRKQEALQRQAVRSAKAGNLPSVQVFAGHNWRSATFREDLAADVSGWNAGAQVTWNFFDGMATYGRIREAKALQRKAEVELEDTIRRVQLEVRTAYSSFVEAGELLDSQVKVQEQAQEALRLANVRSEAGAGIQLDVLSARTALTQARTTQIQAQRDYLVAVARLERAIGQRIIEGRELPPPPKAENP